jgi:hypothetical protein
MASIGKYIYNAAVLYTGIVETGASVAYHVTDASVSCIEAIFSTTATGWNLGLFNGFKGCAKYSLGVHDYKKAVEAFKKRPPLPLPNGSQVVDMRPIGQRLGEFSGHMINGGCKVVTTGVIGSGMAAVIGGTISNALWDDAHVGSIGDFHAASRKLAEGSFLVGKCLGKVGVHVGNAGWAVAQTAASSVYHHPRGVFNLGVGGATLYFTSCQIVKAGKAESYTRKAAHSALATLGLCATALVPSMNPF